MSDPIRKALVARLTEAETVLRNHNGRYPDGSLNFDDHCERTAKHTRVATLREALEAYDAAKLMHGDTAEATTVKIKRLTGGRKKK
jgi:hypothetical protein